MTYLVDSNTFMEAARLYYSFDLAPGFWEWLVSEPMRELIGSVEAVKEEITAGEGDLVDWGAGRSAGGLLAPSRLPVVVVDASAQYDDPIIDNDQAHEARLATEHLLALGHETVWHVVGPEPSFSARRRRASWQQTLEAHGRVVPPVLPGDWSTASGYEAGLRLAGDDEVTAVFTANDQMALGLLRALHEQGLRVPDDVSVVGFDDMEEAADFWPPLTTVQWAVEALIREIESGPHEQREVREVLVPTSLVVRGSTAPPRRGSA